MSTHVDFLQILRDRAHLSPDAMAEYFRHLGWRYSDLNRAGMDPSEVDTRLRFTSPARFDDTLDVNVTCTRVGDSSFILVLELRCLDRHVATAEMTYVNVDARTAPSRAIPRHPTDPRVHSGHQGERMITTPFTTRLGLCHPVASAGMARVAQADLTVAVSEAGGLGCLGGSTFMPDRLREQIASIRGRTDRPYAVNILLPDALTSDDESQWEPVRRTVEALSPEDRQTLSGVEALLTPGVVSRQAEIVLDAAPAVVVITFATPEWFIKECHDRGITVMALVGSIGAAQRASAAGVDIIVAQGTEGGGHTGHASTMALVPGVMDVVDQPVLAAGGIADGRGLAAALCLGAAGVWLGTRFIASDEAFGHDQFKQRVVDSGLNRTALTRSYTGKPLRAFRNEWTTQWQDRTGEIAPFPQQYAIAGPRVETGYLRGDLESGMMPAGQSAQNVHAIKPAGQIVREIVDEAESALREASMPPTH